MIELRVPIWNRQVLVEARVGTTQDSHARTFVGLVDTGSQRSAVSKRVVDALGPPGGPVEYLDVGGIGSSSRSTPAFWLWLGVEFGGGEGEPTPHGRQLSVWQLPPPAPPNFDVLLGMDFLDLFEMVLNRRTCTFRPD